MLNKTVTQYASLFALCALSLQSAAPKGWFLAGSKPAEYETDTDTAAAYNGQPSAYLKATKPVSGFGTLMQQFAATDYLGKRVRYSAFVKSDDVQQWAGLWLRVDKGDKGVAFDNMQQRAIKGTTGWQRYDVVLDVPADATGIAFGILLNGQGEVWINGAGFEVVGPGVPVTDIFLQPKPTAPTNLGFEK